MELNITLLGQMITFAIFVWVTMKFVWPHIAKALQEREETIAEGLAAAERGKHELELSQHKSTEQLREAKEQANHIIDEANKRAAQIIEQAKDKGHQDGKRLVELAKEEIAQERTKAQEALRQEVAQLALYSAEKVLGKNVDAAANRELLDDLLAEVVNE